MKISVFEKTIIPIVFILHSLSSLSQEKRVDQINDPSKQVVSTQNNQVGLTANSQIIYENLSSDGNLVLIKEISSLNTKYGICNRDKKQIYPTIFDQFKKLDNGKYLFISNSITALVSSDFSDNMEWQGTSQVFNSDNFFIVENANKNVIAFLNRNGEDQLPKLGLNKNLKQTNFVINQIFTGRGYSNEYLEISCLDIERGYVSSLIRIEGFQQIVPFNYNSFKLVENGFFCVKKSENGNKNENHCDFYGLDGKLLQSYRNLKIVLKNKILFQNEFGKVGVIDEGLNEIIPFEFEMNLTSNESDAYLTLKKDERFYIFDATGKKLFTEGFQAITPIETNRVIAKRDNKFGVLNLSNRELLPFKYDTIVSKSHVLLAKEGEFWTVFSENGETQLFTNIEMVNISNFEFITLYKSGKWALFSPEISKVLFRYDEMKFEDRTVIFKIDNKWGIMNSSGKEILQATFDEIILDGNNSYKKVLLNGKQGLIKVSGFSPVCSIEIPCTFDLIFLRYGSNGSNFEAICFDKSTGLSTIKKL